MTRFNLPVLGTFALLASCSPSNFDDCVLEGIKGRSSERAISVVETACRRKFERSGTGELELQARDTKLSLDSLEMPPVMILTNPGDDIVTQAKVTMADGTEWTYQVWLEPGTWMDLDPPVDEAPTFMKELREGKVQASIVKVIPSP